MFVAVISSHGHPESVMVFDTQEEALHFAEHKIEDEGWQDKKGHTFEHEGHTHDYHWLLDFGDEDGCGVVVGEGEHDHGHEHSH